MALVCACPIAPCEYEFNLQDQGANPDAAARRMGEKRQQGLHGAPRRLASNANHNRPRATGDCGHIRGIAAVVEDTGRGSRHAMPQLSSCGVQVVHDMLCKSCTVCMFNWFR